MGIVVDIRDIPEAFLEIMSKARGRSWCEFYEEHKGVLNNPFLPDPTCGGEIFLDHHLFLLNEFHSFLSECLSPLPLLVRFPFPVPVSGKNQHPSVHCCASRS